MAEAQAKWVVKTRKALAEAFQVSLFTVDHWRKEWRILEKCPNTSGGYDVRWTARWYLDSRTQHSPKVAARCHELLGAPRPEVSSKEEAAEPAKPPVNPINRLKEQLLENQIRSEAAKAEAAERKNRIAEQDLVSMEDVRRFVSEWFTYMRTMFGRIPRDMEPGLPKQYREQISKELADRIDLVLRSAADYGKRSERIETKVDNPVGRPRKN